MLHTICTRLHPGHLSMRVGHISWCSKEIEKNLELRLSIQGSHLREKTAFFTQKKSRLRKSENAVHLLYTKNSDLTHQNVFSLSFFAPSREGL